MGPRPPRGRGRGLSRLAVLLLPCLLALGAQGRAAAPEELLAPGEAHERPIAAGEAHAWRVEVALGAPLLVTVDQRSISLVVEARGSGSGEPIAAGGSARWGPVLLLLESAGEYRIEVRPREASPWPGRYAIRGEVLPAGPAGAARRNALALMSRAGREALPDTPDARQRAAAAYREALAAWRALGEPAREADALTKLAMLEAGASDQRRAAEDFGAAAVLWRQLGEPHREAETLDWLGVIYLDTQKTESVRAALEGARSLWHDLGQPCEEAAARANLCLLEHRRGSLPVALPCYQENLAFFHRLGVKAQEASILNNIGGVHDHLGEPDAALDSFEQALPLWRAVGDRDSEAKTLNNLARIHRTLGEWQEALRLYGEVRDILETLGDDALEATVLNNIGFIYNDLGEPERALPSFEAALELRRKVGDRTGEVASRNNLGSAWLRLGNPAKALAEHQQALALATSLGSAQLQAISRQGVAEVDLERGDAAAALRELDAATPVLRDKNERRAELDALALRGRALSISGRAREALPVLTQVVARRRELRDRAGEAEALCWLALVERSLGLIAEAREHTSESVSRVEELRTGFVGAGLRAAFLATRRRAFSLAIDLLMDRHAAEPGKGYDREAFAVSERAHARTLLDVLRAGSAGHRATSTAPSELLARRSSLLHRLSAQVDLRWKQSGASAEARGREIDAILTQVDAVEGEIRRHDPRFAAWSTPQPASPAEISSWLEPGTMLLEYSLGEERSFLWAVEAGRVRSFALPAQREIEDLARRVYATLSTVESGSAHRGEAAESLSRFLLGPIWSDAARLRRLVVVPDGVLGILPFAALPAPATRRRGEGPGEPLLEHLAVVYVPSASTLGLQRERLETGAPARKWAAIFADPVFASDDPRLARRSAAGPPLASKRSAGSLGRRAGGGDAAAAFERLPSTGSEAEAVARLAPTGQVWLGLGLAASRQAVLSGELRNYRILHFATHAVADTRNPELSGLVLSQVDAQGRSREGFLGLADIYDLDLDADLVVLSGCQTALGKEVRGEGVISLTRGFQYAGAPRVVASLWRVGDRATAELMTRFYRAMWRDRLPTAVALREAQRSLRHDPRYRDPHSWAGFVLQGDWR